MSDGQSNVDLPPVDDPVLESVKCQLNIGDRIGLEPINRRFARIAFLVKRRMKLKLVDCCSTNCTYGWIDDWSIREPSLKLEVKGPCHCEILTVKISESETALDALFRRVHRWHSIDFANYLMWSTCDSSCHFERQVQIYESVFGQLLDTITTEHSSKAIDIHRFAIHCDSDQSIIKLSSFLTIGACQQLRLLGVHITSTVMASTSLLDTVFTGLPKLNGLHLRRYYSRVRDQEPPAPIARHSFTIRHDHLPRVNRPNFEPLLKKMQLLMVQSDGRDDRVFPFADLAAIVAVMPSSAARVILDYDCDLLPFTWTAVFTDYLPLVHRTRATIYVYLECYPGGLPETTPEDFQTNVATLAAPIQAALIPPDLANAPMVNNRYRQLDFRFTDGAGELSVRRGFSDPYLMKLMTQT